MNQILQKRRDRVNIPASHPEVFTNGILHPELWLWDSWIVRVDETLHLYCLGLARKNVDGDAITPFEFNDYPFHFRHFTSADEGESWADRGTVLSPGNLKDGADSANVWSGSVHRLPSGEILYGYTGIDHPSSCRHFVQTINFAIGQSNGPKIFPTSSQVHPIRDHSAIKEAGYYLPEIERVGHNDGEENGPILGWRDPYIFETGDGVLHALWSAKVGPRTPAVAHAILEQDGDQWRAELQAPIRLPDETEYTQAEVPKLSFDAKTNDFLMMISSCDRIHEQQNDEEVSKGLRLYRAKNIRGPWRAEFEHGSLIHGLDHLFGASFLDLKITGEKVRIVAPYTVKAKGRLPMSFAPIQKINLNR